MAPLGEVDPWLRAGGLVFLWVSIGFRTSSIGFPWFFIGFPWFSESVFLLTVSLDSGVAVLCAIRSLSVAESASELAESA